MTVKPFVPKLYSVLFACNNNIFQHSVDHLYLQIVRAQDFVTDVSCTTRFYCNALFKYSCKKYEQTKVVLFFHMK